MTTPVLVLSVIPAFADEKPAAQTQKKPSITELEMAAAAAKAAYDDAVAAEDAATAALKALQSDTSPLTVWQEQCSRPVDQPREACGGRNFPIDPLMVTE